jgi:AbrB family looped-hinge helix DNA binding protein
MAMTKETATVTSKSMVTIPARIRRKYGIKDGDKIEFVDSNGSILLIPIKGLEELRGVDRKHKKLVIQGIKELEKERRRDAVRGK